MEQIKLVSDLLMLQLPVLFVLAVGNERIIEMVMAFVKKYITISPKIMKEVSALIAFFIALICCGYANILLLPGYTLIPLWLNLVLAAAIVSLGTKVIHDLIELLGAVMLTVKTQATVNAKVSNATRKTF